MFTLGVRDLEDSNRFYRDGLGFPKMECQPEIAFFTLNGSWLGLYNREALAEDGTVSAAGSGFSRFTLAHNVASETQVGQVMQQALSAGATLAKTPRKVFWGGHPGYFKNPGGYLWEVVHNPHFWAGAEDW